MDDDGSQQREAVFPQEEPQCGIMGPEKKSSLQRHCHYLVKKKICIACNGNAIITS